MSLSTRTPARRPAHQPSPSPPARIPQQTDNTALSVNPLRAQPTPNRPSDSNLFDPFVVHPSQDTESPEPQPAKSGSNKPAASRATPDLAAQPNGKLARRRRHVESTPSTPTPAKAVPVPRPQRNNKSGAGLSTSEPRTATVTPQRPNGRRVSTGPVVPAWDSFPICDDSDDTTPPSTPIRESSSVPSKVVRGVTWQQQALLVDDAPRTAPHSGTFNIFSPPLIGTPTPADRRRVRHHQRVPSDGMFNMSADEDSSHSEDIERLKAWVDKFPSRRNATPKQSPSRAVNGDALTASFFAGSAYQNSPSPDELPVPAFRA